MSDQYMCESNRIVDKKIISSLNLNANRSAVDDELQKRAEKVPPLLVNIKLISKQATEVQEDLLKLSRLATQFETLCQDQTKKAEYLEECRKKLNDAKRRACKRKFCIIGIILGIVVLGIGILLIVVLK